MIFALMIAPVMSPAAAATRSEGIVAVVNDDIVSLSDLHDRLKLMIISSGLPDTPDIQARLKNQVLNMLLEETLQWQEARQLGLAVTPEEIQGGFATIAMQNNMEPDQFRSVLRQSGIPVRTLESQIRAQIAWGKVVQRRVRPQIEVSDTDIDDRMDFLKSSLGKTQYRVAEIFLPVDTPQEEAEVQALAQRLVREIVEQRAPFPQVANQFSQSAAAARGGDLDWVQDGQLPDPLNEVVRSLSEGEVSQPVRSLSGYHILFLRGTRTVQAENIPDRDDVLNQIGMERLDRAQRRHLMDLKAEAFIERRI